MTTVSVKPCRCSSRSTCSMIGLLTIGSSGLGMLAVIGRRRVPSPPAITTAFMTASPHRRLRAIRGCAREALTSWRTCTTYRTPAHQYSAVPQIAKAQPKAWAIWLTSAVALAEEQQREGGEQVEGGRLAEEVHRQRAVAVAAQDRQEQGEQDVAADQRQGQPQRHDVADGQPDQRGQDVEPVGGRVEQLAEPGHLVPLAGDLAVQPVGEAADHQQGHGGRVVLVEHQPEEERDAEQAQQAQGVGHGQDAVGHQPRLRHRHAFPLDVSCRWKPIWRLAGGVPRDCCRTRPRRARRGSSALHGAQPV